MHPALFILLKTVLVGQAQWYTLVIPALQEAKVGRSLGLRSLRPAWATWRKPISTKNTKISQSAGTCLWSQLLCKLRQEDHLSQGGEGCSELGSCHFTPAWVTERDPV
uniref:Uncharacterized protein n=1 Tax=Macaca mulatta TaxID=9544 RepID=A0A5F7ZYY8_MACMU